MIQRRVGEGHVYLFESLQRRQGLVHAVSGKPWNMAAHCGPDAAKAHRMRDALCRAFGVDGRRLAVVRQVHGNRVVRAPARMDVSCAEFPAPDADAMFTDHPDVPLMVFSADCPLILVYAPDVPAVGVAHASWRGTVARISANLVAAMTSALDCNPAHMRAAIAPSAGPCCYEIREDAAERVRGELADGEQFIIGRDGRMFLDLWRANAAQLNETGIPLDAIELSRICTICSTDFYSYRREGPHTGRFALLAAITNLSDPS